MNQGRLARVVRYLRAEMLTSVVALLVATLNAIVTALLIADGLSNPVARRLWATSAGTTVFAASWFTMSIDPSTRSQSSNIAGAGMALAMSGLACDALVSAGMRELRAWLTCAIIALGVASLTLTFAPTLALPTHAATAGLLISAVAIRAWLSRTDIDALFSATFIRWFALGALIYILRAALALQAGGARPNGIVFSAFLADILLLLYVTRRRARIRLGLSRGIAYVVLTLGAAFLAALALQWAGFAIDVVQLSITMVVACTATVIFMTMADQTTRKLAALLFPEELTQKDQLTAARSEVATIRSRLEHVERVALVGELAASIAHEVKNPLAALRGWTQILKSHGAALSDEKKPEFEKAIGIVLDAADRIDARVAELLTVTSKSKHETAAVSIELTQLIADVVAVAEGLPGAPAIQLELAPSPLVKGNPDLLRGALLNLLKNAIEASNSTATIVVRTSVVEKRTVIEVVDAGTGLSPEATANLFRAFHSTKAGGTGLGLLVSRTAVEAVGGTLTLSARTDRSGTIARIDLPH